MAFLRKYASDQESFSRFLQKLDKCVRAEKPIESLGGRVISKETLTLCLQEVRPICEFAIRPDDLVAGGQSVFMQSLEKFTRGPEDVDPNNIQYAIVYAQVAVTMTMTLAKAWAFWEGAVGLNVLD